MVSQHNDVHMNDGVIRIRHTTRLDEGFYQCRASNLYGTAVSRHTLLRLAFINRYDDHEVREVNVDEGQSHTIRCNPLPCYPPPNFSWSLRDDHGSLVPVELSNRIQMDEQGHCRIFITKNVTV